MRIIKSTPFSPQKCEFGDFDLRPDEGWKLSKIFIDYESKLLVVSVSIIDESKWIDMGHGSRSIPTNEYKINLNTSEILTHEQWEEYFNYDKVETISDDKKYKLITQRVFEPQRDSDGIKEELYEIETNKMIGSSDSIAFRDSKRENLLEGLYRSIREREERKRILDAKPTLEEYYINQLKGLRENEAIIGYFNDFNTFKLVFANEPVVGFRNGNA